jgi:hypothetical protein
MNLFVLQLVNPRPQLLILLQQMLLLDSNSFNQLDRSHHVVV